MTASAGGTTSQWSQAVGPCFTLASFIRVTGMRVDEVAAAVCERRVLALATSDGVTVFPAFQVVRGAVVQGLRPVLMELAAGSQDPWEWAMWLNADVAGYRSGGVEHARHVDDLIAGRVEKVARGARRTADVWRGV